MKKGDFVLSFFLLVVSIYFLFIALKKNGPAGGFEIYHGRNFLGRISEDGRYGIRLAPPEILPLDDKKESQPNMEIILSGGKARVSRSDCPEQLCVKAGKIAGGSIVCLPNKILIKASGRQDIDAVTK